MTELLDSQVILATLVYCAIGAVVFGLTTMAVVKLAPFSVRKEIEVDQNTALGIVMGSLIIGFAMIISAVMISG